MANVGGVFVVLISGGFVAVLMSVFEMLMDIRRRSKELEIPFTEELLNEIRFIIKCSGNTKTVTQKKISSRVVSLVHESHSPSRISCSPPRDFDSPDIYGFRPSVKSLENQDLASDNDDKV